MNKIAWMIALRGPGPRGSALPPPFELHPDNPHYFLFRGKPTVLIPRGSTTGRCSTSTSITRSISTTLQADGLNLTRTFSGAYCEARARSTSPATRWPRRPAGSSALGAERPGPAMPTAATNST